MVWVPWLPSGTVKSALQEPSASAVAPPRLCPPSQLKEIASPGANPRPRTEAEDPAEPCEGLTEMRGLRATGGAWVGTGAERGVGVGGAGGGASVGAGRGVDVARTAAVGV